VHERMAPMLANTPARHWSYGRGLWKRACAPLPIPVFASRENEKTRQAILPKDSRWGMHVMCFSLGNELVMMPIRRASRLAGNVGHIPEVT
jgi:hypothetical protein